MQKLRSNLQRELDETRMQQSQQAYEHKHELLQQRKATDANSKSYEKQLAEQAKASNNQGKSHDKEMNTLRKQLSDVSTQAAFDRDRLGDQLMRTTTKLDREQADRARWEQSTTEKIVNHINNNPSFHNNVGGGGYGGEGGSGGRSRPPLAKPEPPVLERFRGGKNVQLAGQIRERNHRLQEEYQRNLARYYELGGQ